MNSRKYLLFALFFILTFCSKKEKVNYDTSIFSSNSYSILDVKHKKIFLDSIDSSLKFSTNDSLNRSFLFNLSAEYFFINDIDKSLEVSRRIHDLSKIAKDTFSLARSYYYIGDCYQVKQKDSAYLNYFKSEKLYRKINNKEKIGNVLFKKAYILFFEGNYLDSETELSKSLYFLKDSFNKELLYSAYNLMGCNFEKLEEYDNALKYFGFAKEVLTDLRIKNKYFDKNYNFVVTSAINLSNIYEKRKEFNKSLNELNSVLSDSIKKQWPDDYVAVLGNLGYSKMMNGKLDGVEGLFLNALQLSKQNRNDTNILYQLINLGTYYSLTKNNIKAVNYLNDALQLAYKIKATDEVKTTLKLLSKVDLKNSVSYDDKYIEITDSLNKVQRKNREKYTRIEYETSVIEDKNKDLTNQNLYLIAGLLLVVIVSGSIVTYRYIKSQKNEILHRVQQQKAEEEFFELLKDHQINLSESKELERNRISKELHDSVMNKLYGVRMQLGILNESDEELIKEKRLSYVDMLQDIEQEIRVISHDLHSEGIESQFEFTSLLANLIQQHNEIGHTKFVLKYNSTVDWESISSFVKINIYRIVQEAILNVLKYAEAENCSVLIQNDQAVGIKLLIEDDGKGFNLNINKSGIGLKNIKSRSQSINAELNIETSLGNGTKIEVLVKNS